MCKRTNVIVLTRCACASSAKPSASWLRRNVNSTRRRNSGRRQGHPIARNIRRSVVKGVAGQESVPMNNSSQRDCPQETPKWSYSHAQDTFLQKEERSGATDRKQKRTCSLNWFQNLRRHIL